MTQADATRRLTELRRLPVGWNSYRSRQVTEAAVQTTNVLLTEEPSIMPCSDGGIQLEWHTKGIDFEFRISPDGGEDTD